MNRNKQQSCQPNKIIGPTTSPLNPAVAFFGGTGQVSGQCCAVFFYLAAATMKNTTCDWLDFQLPFFANLYHKQTWQQPGDQKHPKTCSNYGTSLGFQWSPFSKVLFQPPMGSHSLWLACFKGTLFQGIWLASMSLFQGYVLLPSFKGFPRLCFASLLRASLFQGFVWSFKWLCSFLCFLQLPWPGKLPQHLQRWPMGLLLCHGSWTTCGLPILF